MKYAAIFEETDKYEKYTVHFCDNEMQLNASKKLAQNVGTKLIYEAKFHSLMKEGLKIMNFVERANKEGNLDVKKLDELLI